MVYIIWGGEVVSKGIVGYIFIIRVDEVGKFFGRIVDIFKVN